MGLSIVSGGNEGSYALAHDALAHARTFGLRGFHASPSHKRALRSVGLGEVDGLCSHFRLGRRLLAPLREAICRLGQALPVQESYIFFDTYSGSCASLAVSEKALTPEA